MAAPARCTGVLPLASGARAQPQLSALPTPLQAARGEWRSSSSSAADACRRRRLHSRAAVRCSSGGGGGSEQQQRPGRPDRLFSTLNPDTLTHQPGTVWGAAALVAGTTVGAGILALPASTSEAGFAASSAGLVGACVYSIGKRERERRQLGCSLGVETCGAVLRGSRAAAAATPIAAVTGLLLAEVNLATLCELGAGRGVSLRCASCSVGRRHVRTPLLHCRAGDSMHGLHSCVT